MNTASSRPLGMAALLLATTAWGSLFLVGKPLLAHIEPLWFTLVRYTLASAGFALLLMLRGALPWALLRRHALSLAAYGFVGYGVFGAMVLIGLAHSLPSHGAVIMATMPITTQLVRWLLDGVRPTRAVLASTALALAGVVVVSGLLQGGAHAGRSTAAGDAITLLGTLGWIAYTRGSARLPALDVLQYSALTAIACWPLLLVATLAAAALGMAAPPALADVAGAWHALLYIGAVPSVLAILAFNLGVRTLGVVTGTAFLNFVPVSAVLMSSALGAPPAFHELVGVAMVVGALLIHTLWQRPAPAPRTTVARAMCPARHSS